MSSLEKPDGFTFRWTHPYQSNNQELDSEKKLDRPVLDKLAELEITKAQSKTALTPRELTTTATPDPPPLGHDPVGPDFPCPPMPTPPIPDIPLKPPRNPEPKPPDQVPPRTPPEIVPPPQKMPPDI